MKYCMNCGAQMADYETYCPVCGAPASNMGYGPRPMQPRRPMYQPQYQQPLRHCQNCGAQLRPNDAFCQVCGAPAATGGYSQGQNYQQMRPGRPVSQPQIQRPMLHCQNCGAPLRPGERFCRTCGAPTAVEGIVPGQGAQQMYQPQPRLCQNCGSPLGPNDKFCRACGTPVPAIQQGAQPEQTYSQSTQHFCRNCGEQLNPGEKFCPNCGTPVEQPETQFKATKESQSEQTEKTTPEKPNEGKANDEFKQTEDQDNENPKDL